MSQTRVNKGLTIFGVIVFVIGLFCVFYRDQIPYTSSWEYPYKEFGIILSVIGIILTALGLILPRKS